MALMPELQGHECRGRMRRIGSSGGGAALPARRSCSSTLLCRFWTDSKWPGDFVRMPGGRDFHIVALTGSARSGTAGENEGRRLRRPPRQADRPRRPAAPARRRRVPPGLTTRLTAHGSRLTAHGSSLQEWRPTFWSAVSGRAALQGRRAKPDVSGRAALQGRHAGSGASYHAMLRSMKSTDVRGLAHPVPFPRIAHHHRLHAHVLERDVELLGLGDRHVVVVLAVAPASWASSPGRRSGGASAPTARPSGRPRCG